MKERHTQTYTSPGKPHGTVQIIDSLLRPIDLLCFHVAKALLSFARSLGDTLTTQPILTPGYQ